MQKGYVVVENFFGGAEELRVAFEAHFSDPHIHTPQHQVWNYCYVPDPYTYLRTNPAKILPERLISSFVQRLKHSALLTLGVTTHSHPWLSLYVNGCGQSQRIAIACFSPDAERERLDFLDRPAGRFFSHPPDFTG